MLNRFDKIVGSGVGKACPTLLGQGYIGLVPVPVVKKALAAYLDINTVRVHRKLRRAGVAADLNVYVGESHAQY